MPRPHRRSRQLGLTCLLFSTAPVLSASPSIQQQSVEPIDSSLVRRIREEGLRRSHIANDLRHLADVIGPRLTGSPAMDRASRWAARKMQEYGLDSVHLEDWVFGRGWEELSYMGRMLDPHVRPLHGRSLAWSGHTDGPEAGMAVFLDARTVDELESLGTQVNGAWILLDSAGPERRLIVDRGPAPLTREEVLRREVEVPRTPAEAQREAERFRRLFEVRRKLAELGARGIVRRSLYQGAHLGWVESILGEEIPPEVIRPGGVDPLPNVMLSDADYGLVYRNLMSGVPVRLEFDLRSRFVEGDPRAHNTIGEITGTDLRHEVVLIGAHLDSWHAGTGALDEAAGSVVVLEAMRILEASGAAPRRTIRAALWSGEEPEELDHSGLRGSRAYVARHADELARTSVYLNLDQGSGRIRGIWEQRNPAAAGIIAEIMRPLQDLGVVGLKPGYFVGSDDISFAAAGVPAFPFVHDEINTWAYHTDADTFDRVALDDLKQAAVVLAVVAYHLAARAERLPR